MPYASNDIERVLRVITEDRPETIAQARNELPRFVFDEARVTGIRKIDILKERIRWKPTLT